MTDFSDKLRLKEMAEEDIYFARRDQELIRTQHEKDLAEHLNDDAMEKEKPATVGARHPSQGTVPDATSSVAARPRQKIPLQSVSMNDQEANTSRSGFSGSQLALVVLITVLVTASACFWFYRTYVNPSPFQPVALSSNEQHRLDFKLQQLGVNPREMLPNAQTVDQVDAQGRLVPEKYEEQPDKRTIRLSEREVNAIVASNPDLARRFAIDLSDDLASAKLLIPLDPDMPVMGGRTLRVNAGIEMAYRDDRPIVKLRGVSIMGVPVPNAWLGNLKNVDLVGQFGSDPGFWSSFSAGVGLIEIKDGQLHIKLKE